jgi:hypothetical protein
MQLIEGNANAHRQRKEFKSGWSGCTFFADHCFFERLICNTFFRKLVWITDGFGVWLNSRTDGFSNPEGPSYLTATGRTLWTFVAPGVQLPTFAPFLHPPIPLCSHNDAFCVSSANGERTCTLPCGRRRTTNWRTHLDHGCHILEKGEISLTRLTFKNIYLIESFLNGQKIVLTCFWKKFWNI